MAHRVLLVLLVLIFSATFVLNTEGRKLLMEISGSSSNYTPPPATAASSSSSSLASLILGALPKGTVPSSSPSKKGHATLDNEKLFRRHLARIDRILQSVPSPGVGH